MGSVTLGAQGDTRGTCWWKLEVLKGPMKEHRGWDIREVMCYHCGNQGHIARYCTQKNKRDCAGEVPHEEKMYCSFSWHKRPLQRAKLVVDIKIGDLLGPVVVDMGCTQMMLKSDLILPHVREEDMLVSMVCIHRASYTYQSL